MIVVATGGRINVLKIDQQGLIQKASIINPIAPVVADVSYISLYFNEYSRQVF